MLVSGSKGGIMKVRSVMKRDVKFCSLTATLADAARVMEAGECGAVPLVNESRRVVGMITDRDVCLALGRHRAAGDLPVSQVASGKVYGCGPDDDVADALATMEKRRVRRLPVVDDEGRLCGILSMDDVVLRAERANGRRTEGVSYGETLHVLKSIYRRSGNGKALVVSP
jgi:CBS domain-containing protein